MAPPSSLLPQMGCPLNWTVIETTSEERAAREAKIVQFGYTPPLRWKDEEMLVEIGSPRRCEGAGPAGVEK